MNQKKTFVDYIPPHRKQIYFRIIDNVSAQNLHPITLRLHFLEEHFPPNKLDEALIWLVKNNVTGLRFINWFNHQCKSSDLEMHARLIAIVDNNRIIERPIAGKTFKQ